MTKRILDLLASDIPNMTKADKLVSIKSAEGRTMVSEYITTAAQLFEDLSNVEVGTAFGTDLLLLNVFDVNNPHMNGVTVENKTDTIQEIKNLTGKLVGVNLEPIDLNTDTIEQRIDIAPGRIGTPENVSKLVEQGADMVVFTGNPKTGVTNEAIIQSIKGTKEQHGDDIIIMAGKMHASGSATEMGSKIIDKVTIKDFVDAGADIILLPAPGTVPGMMTETVREFVEYTHSLGAMTMTAVGTSQEGADPDTIKQIALYSKMTGTDMHHMGDAGMPNGMSIPENIMTYSIAIRGKRHTYRAMARSLHR